MELFRSNSPRRRELRRGASAEPKPWQEWLQRRDVFWAGVFTLVLATAASVTAISAQNRPHYAAGQVVSEAVVTRFNFRAVNETETNKKKADASARTPPVYNANIAYFSDVRERVNSLIKLVADPNTTLEQIPQETRTALNLRPEALD